MVPCIGIASGIGAGNPGCKEGPIVLKEHLQEQFDFRQLITSQTNVTDPLSSIALSACEFAKVAYLLAKEKKPFFSMGGDHSSSIGLISGIASAFQDRGDLGLIWIDAHMDSHTMETTPSGNIHGMPVAALLGFGAKSLTSICSPLPKIKPENLVLVGIRDYEIEEKELLDSLNVRIYYMDEVQKRGLKDVLKEAVQHVTTNTCEYCISFDLDCMDPKYAPGVGTPVPNGIDPKELFMALSILSEAPPFVFELVEYNPFLDQEHQTLSLIKEILSRLTPSMRQEYFCSSL